MSAAGALVVLTEDAGTSGWAPVAACVRAICDQLVANIHWPRVRVLPRADASAQVLGAVGANRWKGGDGYSHSLRVQLVRYVVDKLLDRDGERRFVFFHVDADQPWSVGGLDRCEVVEKFDRLIRTPVKQQLLPALQKLGRAGELDDVMRRLHLLVPTVAIESWLYQNTAVASAACRGRPCAGAHVAHYDAWRDDRTLLDDITGLKGRRDLHCLDDKDKGALAQQLPAAEMRRAGRSFARAVELVGEDGALLHMLIATGAPPTA